MNAPSRDPSPAQVAACRNGLDAPHARVFSGAQPNAMSSPSVSQLRNLIENIVVECRDEQEVRAALGAILQHYQDLVAAHDGGIQRMSPAHAVKTSPKQEAIATRRQVLAFRGIPGGRHVPLAH